MQQLAEAAGMTKGAPYYHFKNKDDLFISVFVREVERITDEMIRCLEEQGSLRDRLKAAVRHVMETTQGDFNQLFTDFERHMQANHERVHQDLDRIDMSVNLLPFFQSARSAGEFSRLSAEMAVEFFMLMLFGQMKFLQFDKTRPENYRPPHERANDLIDLLFDGI
jgi:AcrR family transcriptional regulator